MVDLEFLASIQIFSFFTRAELEAAEKLFSEVVFAKGDDVVRIGEPGDTFYVVLDGELEVGTRASRPARRARCAAATTSARWRCCRGASAPRR